LCAHRSSGDSVLSTSEYRGNPVGHVDPGSYRPSHRTTKNPAQRRPEMARFRRTVLATVTAAFTTVGTGVVAIASLSNRAPTDRRTVIRFTGRRLRTALALATLFVGIGSTSAMAQPPAWETIAVDETYLLPRTSATCGFEVYKHDFGTLEISDRGPARRRCSDPRRRRPH
jgi:hypothetical protein